MKRTGTGKGRQAIKRAEEQAALKQAVTAKYLAA
jgi:hypothetical protein